MSYAPKDGTVLLVALDKPISHTTLYGASEDGRYVTLARWNAQARSGGGWVSIDSEVHGATGQSETHGIGASMEIDPIAWMDLPPPPRTRADVRWAEATAV